MLSVSGVYSYVLVDLINFGESETDVRYVFVQDVVLLFYTPWCGFCKVFSHVYLSLAEHFDLIDNLVFAR